MISIFPVPNIPILNDEGTFWEIIITSLKDFIEDNDILVFAHTPYSRVFGPKYTINNIIPSEKAKEIAENLDKDPRKIEIVLRSSNQVIKTGRNVIIAENKAGIVCANAGIDESNAGIGCVIGIPDDPDNLAREMRDLIKKELTVDVRVIISDTVGRALRKGAVNIGIGVAGIPAMKSEIGKPDLFGYTMQVSQIAIADELASAAELIQGQTNEASPLVIIRGYEVNFEGEESAKVVNRPEDERLFK